MKVLLLLGIVVLLCAICVVMPLVLIWALNVLLPIAIPITLKTWFASWLILGLFSPRVEIQRA